MGLKSDEMLNHVPNVLLLALKTWSLYKCVKKNGIAERNLDTKFSISNVCHFSKTHVGHAANMWQKMPNI